MAFKRVGSEPQPERDRVDVKVVDELVKKALAVNPSLREGRDTDEVVQDLRRDVMTRSASASAAAQAAKSGAANAAKPGATRDPRLQTIEIFAREKASTYPKQVLEIEGAIANLRQQIDDARDTTIREICELVGVLIQTGADARECQGALAQFPDLLKQLKVSDGELIERARKRK